MGKVEKVKEVGNVKKIKWGHAQKGNVEKVSEKIVNG